MNRYQIVLLCLIICLPWMKPTFSQDKPVKIALLGSLQSQTEAYKAADAIGFGVGANMTFILSRHFDYSLKVHYDYLALSQNNVLDEWEWDYWEDTYIDFLPGTEPEIVNKTLSYTSTDSIYSATFHPTQRLKELRLLTGFDYHFPVYKNISLYAGLDAGISLFTRQLHIEENWTKRFKLDSLSTGKFDYNYEYDLLHFAPPKKGTKLFIAPHAGIKFLLNYSLDFTCGVQYLQYINQDKLLGMKLSEHGNKWFPVKAKIMLMLGLVFKY